MYEAENTMESKGPAAKKIIRQEDIISDIQNFLFEQYFTVPLQYCGNYYAPIFISCWQNFIIGFIISQVVICVSEDRRWFVFNASDVKTVSDLYNDFVGSNMDHKPLISNLHTTIIPETPGWKKIHPITPYFFYENRKRI